MWGGTCQVQSLQITRGSYRFNGLMHPCITIIGNFMHKSFNTISRNCACCLTAGGYGKDSKSSLTHLRGAPTLQGAVTFA